MHYIQVPEGDLHHEETRSLSLSASQPPSPKIPFSLHQAQGRGSAQCSREEVKTSEFNTRKSGL